MQETNVRSMIDAIDAKLPNVAAVIPGRKQVPVGTHHFVLSKLTLATQTQQGGNVTTKLPRLDWDFQVLASEDDGQKFKGRKHRHFMTIDPNDEESIGEFRGFAAKIGHPEELQNSIGETMKNLEDPKNFLKRFGPLPMIEAKINAGKTKKADGSFSHYLNPVRVLENGEEGKFDSPGGESFTPPARAVSTTQATSKVVAQVPPAQPATSTPVEEEQLPWPSAEEVKTTMTPEEVRVFLTQDIGIDAAKLPEDEVALRSAGSIVAAIGSDADAPWDDIGQAALLSAFGLNNGKSAEKTRASIIEAINKAIG